MLIFLDKRKISYIFSWYFWISNKKMIFDLKTAYEKPVELNLTLSPEWWKADGYDDAILGLDRALYVHIYIKRAGKRYVLEGKLAGGLILRCDRCIESFHFDLNTEFRLFLMHHPEHVKEEIELGKDDMSIIFVSEDEIELDDIIRSEIYLAVPMKVLCKEDCAGLCPQCGKNLNKGKCKCRKERGHPAFLKLKDIKLKGEQNGCSKKEDFQVKEGYEKVSRQG